MANNYNSDFQAPAVVREPVDAVLAKLGISDERNRAFIMSQAAVMKVDTGLLDIPENVAEVVKSAKYTQEYGFMPGIHLHMQTFKSKAKRKGANGATVEVWEERVTLVVGEQAYKASARQHAAAERDYIDFETETMTREELIAYVSANMPDVELTEEDRGARARVLSYKGAEIAKMMGKKYDPEWSYGFCFMKGVPKVYEGKKSYPKSDRDRIPNQRTALDVAVRRAVKAAVMRKYPLVPIDKRSTEQRQMAVIDLAATETDDDRHAAPIAGKSVNYEDDGDILYASNGQPSGNTQPPDEEEGQFVQAPETAGEASPPNPFDDPNVGAQAEERRDYGAIADKLTGKAQEFATFAFRLHLDSDQPSSSTQHNFLTSIIDKAVGQDVHRHVLSVLCRKYIGGGAHCGKKLASFLLDYISPNVAQVNEKGEKVKENGKQVYVTNPKFRQDYVDVLKEIATTGK